MILVLKNSHFIKTGLLNAHKTCFACADPEGDRGPDPPEKIQKYRVSGSTGPDHLKNQVSIQCKVIIGPPVKCHLMSFCWRANNGSLLVVF